MIDEYTRPSSDLSRAEIVTAVGLSGSLYAAAERLGCDSRNFRAYCRRQGIRASRLPCGVPVVIVRGGAHASR